MRSARVVAYFPMLVVAALLLRAFIPLGYMPAAPGSGLLLELCPTASPAVAMSGEERGHEHKHTEQDGSDSDVHQCPLGHLLVFAIATADPWQIDVPAGAAVDALAPSTGATGILPTHQRNRGPPARKAAQYT